MFMKKSWDILDILGDNAMKTAGKKARQGIDNFMKAFEDYEVEHIVADIEVAGKIPTPKFALQIKMKKRKGEDK